MSGKLTVHQVEKIEYKQATSVYGIKRNKSRILKCEHCQKEFEHNCDEHLYKYKDKVFCTYTCKRGYLRKEGIIE